MSETSIEMPTTSTRGWTYPGVIIIETFIMMIAMGVDALWQKELGIISNVSIVIVALIGALKVRRPDYLSAIWAPVLAWFIALMTVGQMLPKRSTHFVREQALHIVYGLAQHAWWILGATLLSAIVAIWRRNRKPKI